VNLFLDELHGGQITEAQMDAVGIPTVENDDHRSLTKKRQSDTMSTAGCNVE
jgi:hypothetical protein